jgi:hypothetical protein
VGREPCEKHSYGHGADRHGREAKISDGIRKCHDGIAVEAELQQFLVFMVLARHRNT